MRSMAVLAICIGVLAWTPAVHAADRFADPAGIGSEPCVAILPCGVVQAINGAGVGDTVWLNPGAYASPENGITTEVGDGGRQMTIRGLTGGPLRPTLWLSNGGLSLTGAGTILRDVKVANDEASAVTNPNGLGSVTLERVLAQTSATFADACTLTSSSLVINSVCWAQGNGSESSSGLFFGGAEGAARTLTLRNVTAVGRRGIDVGMNFERVLTVNGTNVIARGAAADIRAVGSGTNPAAVALTRSSFATIDVTDAAVTPPGSAGNPTAAPVFRDAPNGDFRPAVGSPTIGAGNDDAANGTTDLDGNPRMLGSGTDIGAYEYVPGAPLATTGASSGVGSTAATVAGTVNPGDQSTTYFFRYGTSTAYGSTTAPATSGAGTAARGVSARLTGLQPARTYHYRVEATNASGADVGADRTFTTPAPPAPPPRCDGRPATIVGSGRIVGTPRADVIVGSAGADRISGGGGADRICARAGNDRLRGGRGRDLVFGELGNDRAGGGTGNDTVDGGAGNDLLDERGQGGGRDTLAGRDGADKVFTAGAEPDTVDCGPKRDRATVDRLDRVRRCERVRRIKRPSERQVFGQSLSTAALLHAIG